MLSTAVKHTERLRHISRQNFFFTIFLGECVILVKLAVNIYFRAYLKGLSMKTLWNQTPQVSCWRPCLLFMGLLCCYRTRRGLNLHKRTLRSSHKLRLQLFFGFLDHPTTLGIFLNLKLGKIDLVKIIY